MLTWIRSPGGAHVNYSIFGDAYDAVEDTVSTIQDALASLGKYCVEWANGGLKVFHQLISSATEMLTFNTSDTTFAAFNTVVNRVSGVLTVIASSLLVMFFLTSLAGDAWDTRHELDVWSLTKDIVKLIVSVVVVNNALYLTRLIFNSGAALAELVLGSSTNMDNAVTLSDEKSQYLIHGVSGIGGVMLLIAFVLGAIVITVCGIMITIEIYQRIFKIYILIPCSTLAFSTFVISSGRGGREVFGGYIKSICQTALEAMIIMLAISFTYMLVDNSRVMNTLFPADVYEATAVKLTSVNDYAAVYAFMMYYNEGLTYNEAAGTNGFKSTVSDVDSRAATASARVKNKLSSLSHPVSDMYWKYASDSDSSYHQLTMSSLAAMINVNAGASASVCPDIKVRLYPEASVKDALFMLAQLVFPCLLCLSAVKAVDKYTGMVLGR